jgi:hypothetical protein
MISLGLSARLDSTLDGSWELLLWALCSVESNAIDGVYGKLELLHEKTCGSAVGGGGVL